MAPVFTKACSWIPGAAAEGWGEWIRLAGEYGVQKDVDIVIGLSIAASLALASVVVAAALPGISVAAFVEFTGIGVGILKVPALAASTFTLVEGLLSIYYKPYVDDNLRALTGVRVFLATSQSMLNVPVSFMLGYSVDELGAAGLFLPETGRIFHQIINSYIKTQLVLSVLSSDITSVMTILLENTGSADPGRVCEELAPVSAATLFVAPASSCVHAQIAELIRKKPLTIEEAAALIFMAFYTVESLVPISTGTGDNKALVNSFKADVVASMTENFEIKINNLFGLFKQSKIAGYYGNRLNSTRDKLAAELATMTIELFNFDELEALLNVNGTFKKNATDFRKSGSQAALDTSKLLSLQVNHGKIVDEIYSYVYPELVTILLAKKDQLDIPVEQLSGNFLLTSLKEKSDTKDIKAIITDAYAITKQNFNAAKQPPVPKFSKSVLTKILAGTPEFMFTRLGADVPDVPDAWYFIDGEIEAAPKYGVSRRGVAEVIGAGLMAALETYLTGAVPVATVARFALEWLRLSGLGPEMAGRLNSATREKIQALRQSIQPRR